MQPEPAKPAVYFDGACPLCSNEIDFYRRQQGAEAVEWVDVSRCDGSALGAGLTRDAALQQMHFRRQDGQLVAGAAAFTHIWRSLPRFAWLGRVLGSRLGLWFLERAYRIFLMVRPLWHKRA